MACGTCSINKDKDGKVSGCGSGGCSSGGCNRLNTFDWLADMPIAFGNAFDIIEVSFQNGSRKGFYKNDKNIQLSKGDAIVVEGKGGVGQDIGEVNLQGELVRLQMKKKRVKEDNKDIAKVLRIPHQRDLDRLQDCRSREKGMMIRSRELVRELKLDMKIGQVEMQGDGRKCTFYYIADGRVDFRELIKRFAGEFKVKVEMRQIGARQEAGKIGGIGPCGRELCCSTWLTQFKSVSTGAARYQNLSISQNKLSGQCGRLKCCLNYELDAYMDALKDFPKNANYLHTEAGKAKLMKTDIFKRLMWYKYEDSPVFHSISVNRVKDILALNKKDKKPEGLVLIEDIIEAAPDFTDGSGMLTLEVLEKAAKKKKRQKYRKSKKSNRSKGSSSNNPNSKSSNSSGNNKSKSNKSTNSKSNSTQGKSSNSDSANKSSSSSKKRWYRKKKK